MKPTHVTGSLRAACERAHCERVHDGSQRRAPLVGAAILTASLTGAAFAVPTPRPVAPPPACPAPGGADACAPAGFGLPRLALNPGPKGGRREVLFRGGDALAFGAAWLVLEGYGGATLPAGTCTTGVQGRIAGPHALDADGVSRWEVPAAAFFSGACLRVAAWAPGASSTEGVLSNSVQLPLRPPKDAEGLKAGEVVVTEFMKDPSHVSDSTGEWVELHNPSAQAVDIEGWSLSDLGSDFTILDNSGLGIVIPPGGYLVLGKSIDPAQNGEVPVDIVYTGFTLSNGDDEIVLARPSGVVVDAVVYDDGVTFPDTGGNSVSLRPDRLDAVSNDDGANWCHGTSPISSNNPDTGTPKLVNDPCL